MKGFFRVFSGVLLVGLLCTFCLWRKESLPDLSHVGTALQGAVGQIGAISDLIEGGIPTVPPTVPENDGASDLPYTESELSEVLDADFEQTLLGAVTTHTDKVDVSRFSLTSEQIRERVSQFLFTHPELFYVNTAYRIGTLPGSSTVSQIQFDYLYGAAEVSEMTAAYENTLDEIAAGVEDGASDFDKILYLHDYFIRNYAYDYEGLEDGTAIRDAYRFFEEKTGVCQAYMLALIAAANEVGLECLPVTSTEMNHAWNIVKIDGKWYHIDVTWDDAGGESAPVYPSYVSYDYFLLSGEKLYRDGRTVTWETTQSATDTTYDTARWREAANTPLVKVDGVYYCVVYDGMGAVMLSGSPTAMEAVRDLGSMRWSSPRGGSYAECWSSIVAYGEQLIFNSESALYAFNPETELPVRVVDLSDALGGLQIFGIVEIAADGTVTYVAAADYRGEFVLKEYRLSA